MGLAHRCPARLRLGRELGHLPVAEAAWSAGDIGAEHVSAIAGVRNEVTQGSLGPDEAMLVEDEWSEGGGGRRTTQDDQ